MKGRAPAAGTPADEGPAPAGFEGQPISCAACPLTSQHGELRCVIGYSCREDRYAPRVIRFFREHPELASDSLNHPYFEVRATAVRYANVFRLPPLLDDEDETVRAAVAARVPKRLLRVLMDDPHREVRIRVAQLLSVAQLPLMRHDPDYFVRAQVAARIAPAFLPAMLEDPDSQVRLAVAKRVAARELSGLWDDPDSLVRREVARRCDTWVLERMLTDEAWLVRYEVAGRAPAPMLRVLAQDADVEVSSRARARLAAGDSREGVEGLED